MSLALSLMLLTAFSPQEALEGLADRVIGSRGEDPDAEAALRESGPSGLEILIARRQKADLAREELASIDQAIDRVAQQRYGSVSRLYWFTDLELAKAEAQRTQRPILSLRMLGHLNEELSCANSRFFRTVLYADPQVAALMRDRFVMHWSSERDVPVITIDFGDGRIMRRTVTGNSVHYILDEQGRVLDAIPGLYSPGKFIAELRFASSRPSVVAHQQRASELETAWSNEVERQGLVPKTIARRRAPATLAVMTAPSKAFVEAPMLISPHELKAAMTDIAWTKLTNFAGKIELSRNTLALMRAENPHLSVKAFESMVLAFRRSLAIDTVKNQLLLRREVHQELSQRPSSAFQMFNAWVYSELFATPAADAWLGLHDDSVYTGLEGAGLFIGRPTRRP
jgi:hypothetical protein